MDQLPGQRRLLRAHLEHRRRLLVLPRRPAAAADALPVQQRAARRRAAGTCTCATTTAASSGRRRGSRWAGRSRTTGAGTGSDTRRSARRAAASSVETLYFVPLGETLEVWRVRVTNRRDAAASLSLFSAVEFCLWDALGRPTNFQRNFYIGEVEVDGSVIYHTTEYRERRDHFAYFACSEDPVGFDTPREAFLGPYRGWDRPVVVETGQRDRLDRARLGADRLAPGRARRWRRARRARCGSSSATPRTRRDAKFARPGASEPGARPPGHPTGTSTPRSSRRRSTRCARAGRSCSAGCRCRRRTSTSTGWSTSGTPTSAWSRSTCPGRRRSSSPASAAGWASATLTRTCSASCTWCPTRARERILDLAATQLAVGRRLPPVPAAHEARQRRGRLRLQRRPAVARPRRRRLSQGDRRPRRSSTSRCRSTTQPGQRGAAVRAPAAVGAVHARPARPARPAADRPRRLERLPQPQLLLRDAGRVVPDDREPRGRRRRVGVHRRAVRARGRASWRRSPTARRRTRLLARGGRR